VNNPVAIATAIPMMRRISLRIVIDLILDPIDTRSIAGVVNRNEKFFF
jgi:hypothetical protein